MPFRVDVADAAVDSAVAWGIASRYEEPLPLQCSSTAGVRAPLLWLWPLWCRADGEDSGLSFGGDEERGVKMLLGEDPRVAIWDGEDGGFVDRVK